MSDHNQERAKKAIEELQQQLHDAYDAVQRLKLDIPGEHFPEAYEISRTIRDLRKTIAQLNAQLNDETMELDIDFNLFNNEQIDRSESSASLC